MSPSKIAAAVLGTALLALLLWYFALRVRDTTPDLPATERAAARERPARKGSGGTAADAPATPVQPPAPVVTTTPAMRFGVCQREEAPARLSRIPLIAGRPELWALHCGRSLHVIDIQEIAGTLVPQRVALVQASSPSPAETPVATPAAAADVDGDGRNDLLAPVMLVDAAGAARGGAVYWLRGSASGGFDAPANLLLAAPAALVALKLDEEAGQDLALLNRQDSNTGENDELWLIQGGPSPQRIAQRPAGVGSSALAALDLDLDGRDDLVAASTGEGKVRAWLTSKGALAHVEPLELELPGVSQTLVADLDGDAVRELVVAGDRAALIHPRADGALELTPIAGTDGLRDLQVADADGNGKPDLIGYVHPDLLAVAPDAAPGAERMLVASLRGEVGVLFARVAQLDRDPQLDLVLVVQSSAGDLELAIARNLKSGALVALGGTSEPLADAALLERFTAM
jgi:hypothetical protein